MNAEPYICKKGRHQGSIEWFSGDEPVICDFYDRGDCWRCYADFEREKLEKLSNTNPEWDIGICIDSVPENRGYVLPLIHRSYNSKELIGFDGEDLFYACESSRLLKRAEFLKAVCEKEGVEWLPKTKLTGEETARGFAQAVARGMREELEARSCSCADSTPERETYTQAEVDDLLEKYLEQSLRHLEEMKREEKEWRKALLPCIAEILELTHTKNHWMYAEKKIEDLRRRFL